MGENEPGFDVKSLIGIFRKLSEKSGRNVKKGSKSLEEYQGWKETEEEYKKKQEEWLESVKKRKSHKDKTRS